MIIHRAHQEKFAIHRENAPWINLHRFTEHVYLRGGTTTEITREKNVVLFRYHVLYLSNTKCYQYTVLVRP